MPAVFDVTDYDAVLAAVNADLVDILVNNAGNAGRATTMGREDLRTLVDTEPDDWEGFIRVNMYGVMYAVRAALPGMIEAGWGRVVTVISDAARVGETHMPAYAAAKAAAAGFSRAVAREVGRHGITVNCVSLGTMNTQGIPPEQDEIAAQMVKRYAIRRRGLPRDIASMVTFLASPQAEWITGQTYPVNGGYSFAL
jgi:3-oxoacyl-[acyl-carrier protein] reductase